MSSMHVYDEKGKAKPKAARTTIEASKETNPLKESTPQPRVDPTYLKEMQQTVGNSAVQRFLAQRNAQGAADVDEETAAAINQQRGSGQTLDDNMAVRAGQAMGHDFSNVTVHTDSEADQLSQALGARAFTTGSDIFFKEGTYNPASSDGQHLIAHELTHVVQQSGSAPAVQGKMRVNDPNDAYEAEADQVANKVMSMPASLVQQQEALQLQEEEEDVQMQAEEEVQMQEEEEEALQMQEEEDEVQMQEEEEVQMQEEEEELQMQAEEEDVQMQAEDGAFDAKRSR